ncbi:MAG TPA: hypothetical protein DCQ98_02395 [Planctomycetaceae bacterium]|nr:hypothetical protein [Planctomycetaceae bacterium]
MAPARDAVLAATRFRGVSPAKCRAEPAVTRGEEKSETAGERSDGRRERARVVSNRASAVAVARPLARATKKRFRPGCGTEAFRIRTRANVA